LDLYYFLISATGPAVASGRTMNHHNVCVKSPRDIKNLASALGERRSLGMLQMMHCARLFITRPQLCHAGFNRLMIDAKAPVARSRPTAASISVRVSKTG
jgi:hypothetical protein